MVFDLELDQIFCEEADDIMVVKLKRLGNVRFLEYLLGDRPVPLLVTLHRPPPVAGFPICGSFQEEGCLPEGAGDSGHHTSKALLR